MIQQEMRAGYYFSDYPIPDLSDPRPMTIDPRFLQPGMEKGKGKGKRKREDGDD